MPERALAAPCGIFYLTQTDSNGSNESGPSIGSELPPSGTSQDLIGGGGTGGCSGGIPPPTGPAYAVAYHHRDHLGSLRVVTDAGGWKISGHDYYPFGTEMGVDNGDGSRKRFTGHERDATTGMDYMLARFGNAALARFVAVDPLSTSASAESPQTWNRFSYVANSPINFNDPTGLAGSPSAGSSSEERTIGYRVLWDKGLGDAQNLHDAAVEDKNLAFQVARAYAGGVDNFPDDGAANAIQHAVGACFMARDPRIGPELANELTDAHETGDSLSTPQQHEQDLHNNSVGLELAGTTWVQMECIPLVMDALEKGQLQTSLNPEGSPTPLLDEARLADEKRPGE